LVPRHSSKFEQRLALGGGEVPPPALEVLGGKAARVEREQIQVRSPTRIATRPEISGCSARASSCEATVKEASQLGIAAQSGQFSMISRM
jgi:hypothetical protein